MSIKTKKSIAVLIPCYNEEVAIASVVKDFRKELPEAKIYVYDNNSKDQTAANALKAGAIVRKESRQGKGYVVRRMFANIEADIYIMIDGDNTYDSSSVHKLIAKLQDENLDMVVGTRKFVEDEAYRAGHKLGNWLFTTCIKMIFGRSFTDILSGYRAFSRRFVKSFPCTSGGFEIESELTVHSLDLELPVGEVETHYFARPEGSQSKLSTYKDGYKISRMILTMIKEFKPFIFFGSWFALFAIAAIGFATPLVFTYLETGLVPRMPTAILSTGLMLLAFLCLFSGIILDSLNRGRKEIKRLKYLDYPINND